MTWDSFAIIARSYASYQIHSVLYSSFFSLTKPLAIVFQTEVELPKSLREQQYVASLNWRMFTSASFFMPIEFSQIERIQTDLHGSRSPVHTLLPGLPSCTHRLDTNNRTGLQVKKRRQGLRRITPVVSSPFLLAFSVEDWEGQPTDSIRK